MRSPPNHTGYHQLAVRLNRFPQGAPVSGLLFDILKILFSENEARLVSRLPVRVFNVHKACRAWGQPIGATRRILNRLCRKALLIDIVHQGETLYCLPPPMAGFFEFSMMRTRSDIDQPALARLFYQYINMQEDFATALFTRGQTPLGRIYVDEHQIPQAHRLEVMDHDRSTCAVREATAIGISQCYCRHKMVHLDRACDAPRNICMTLNTTAASLTRHGHARRIGADEALDMLQLARTHHLVQFGENVRRRPNFICNCCGCCCEGMIAARRFAMFHPVQTTNFVPAVATGACSGCGRCARVCPVKAIALSLSPPEKKIPAIKIDLSVCLGCGVCAHACPTGAIGLQYSPRRVVTPLNTAHRVIMMAIERGMLQHIIFDNQVLYSHRAMAVLLGVIFKLPPIKRILAGRQLRSRYLESMIRRFEW